MTPNARPRFDANIVETRTSLEMITVSVFSQSSPRPIGTTASVCPRVYMTPARKPMNGFKNRRFPPQSFSE